MEFELFKFVTKMLKSISHGFIRLEDKKYQYSRENVGLVWKDSNKD